MVHLEQQKWTLGGNFMFHLILVVSQGAPSLGIYRVVTVICGFDLILFFSLQSEYLQIYLTLLYAKTGSTTKPSISTICSI